MKVTVTRSLDVGGHRTWALQIERTTAAERTGWASEDVGRFRMALEAILAAPDRAAEIATEAMGYPEDPS